MCIFATWTSAISTRIAASSRRCAASATATRSRAASPTGRSTACAPTTPRWTRTGSICRSPRPSRARPALELLLPLTLKWGQANKLGLAATLARITSEPARILGVASGRLAAGAPADIVLFDPAAPVRIAPETLKSQGKNTPFLGYELAGRVRTTIVAGNVVYEA